MHAAKLLEEEKKRMADTAVSLQQNLEVGVCWLGIKPWLWCSDAHYLVDNF